MDLLNHKAIAPSGLANIIFSSTFYEEANIYFSKFLFNLGSIDLTDKSIHLFFIWSLTKMAFQIVTVKKLFLGEGIRLHARKTENLWHNNTKSSED